ncbi:MDR family NADP-dependent oxidoreductase [Dyella choica]|uniref:NADP-dependent oxidoreductase n=1 Tax=Dyella choica TaxID=1927959 RepID=A0A432M641_9GAMM|nr:NADP-dependent oxidoreductase [Dyella choica]RUL75977.1 NADP-dependent oxidoreductase [Dyella choica]
MAARSTINREVKLARHSTAELLAEHFAVKECDVPTPCQDDVVVRNRWFRVSVSTRLMAREGAEAIEGIPFPPLRPGDTLADAAIGEVIHSGSTSGVAVGSLVMHSLGWREFAVVRGSECTVLESRNTDPAAFLGHGWTAYAALTQGVQIHQGDTVFVSSGAGAIGSMAGQIARQLGAGRVIGSTSTPDKAHWMATELGYDAVVTRGNGPLIDQLKRAAPDGIDVIVDMVGGEQLSASIAVANEGARCVLLGALTAELDSKRATLQAPVELDGFQIILKGMTLRGFSASEDASDMFDAWIHQQEAWQREGVIQLPCTIFKGIEQAPLALQEACAGRLKGVVLVEL